jgi:hypothetical protein
MKEHDAEIYREAYESMAEVQKSSEHVIAVVCRPGTRPNTELAKDVGLVLDDMLFAMPETTAEATRLNELLVRSNAAQVFNV